MLCLYHFIVSSRNIYKKDQLHFDRTALFIRWLTRDEFQMMQHFCLDQTDHLETWQASQHHHNGISWVLCHHKSLTIQLHVQQLVQDNNQNPPILDICVGNPLAISGCASQRANNVDALWFPDTIISIQTAKQKSIDILTHRPLHLI